MSGSAPIGSRWWCSWMITSSSGVRGSSTKLLLEQGVGGMSASEVRAVEQRLHGAAERQGRRLVPPPDDPETEASSFAEAFTCESVIRDVAWDGRLDRLLLLLAAGVVGSSPALDLLDPATAEIRRVSLRFPAGAEPQSLSQIVAGHNYLWFRNHGDDSRTYRLRRTTLHGKGQRLTVAEVSRLQTEASD